MIVGDFVARDVYEDQPVKFAAMEYETGPDQTEYIGGICTDGEVKGGIPGPTPCSPGSVPTRSSKA